jgi:hypothetical protein
MELMAFLDILDDELEVIIRINTEDGQMQQNKLSYRTKWRWVFNPPPPLLQLLANKLNLILLLQIEKCDGDLLNSL